MEVYMQSLLHALLRGEGAQRADEVSFLQHTFESVILLPYQRLKFDADNGRTMGWLGCLRGVLRR